MNCQECLAVVATGSVAELEHNDAVRRHYSACPECSRVVRSVAEGEKDLAAVLNAIPSRVPATVTAETAIAVARRRKIARLLSIAFAALIVVTLWITWVRVIVPGMQATAELARSNLITETIKLECLSSEQAGDLISPYVRTNGSLYYIAKPPLRVITVRATAEELRNVRTVLERFDNSSETACAAP